MCRKQPAYVQMCTNMYLDMGEYMYTLVHAYIYAEKNSFVCYLPYEWGKIAFSQVQGRIKLCTNEGRLSLWNETFHKIPSMTFSRFFSTERRKKAPSENEMNLHQVKSLNMTLCKKNSTFCKDRNVKNYSKRIDLFWKIENLTDHEFHL